MGLFDFLKKKAPSEQDEPSITDLKLQNLRKGYFVDYDLRTWQVTAANRYDWGGEEGLEWMLAAADEKLSLAMVEDDDVEWSMSRPIEFGALTADVEKSIIERGDPPQQVQYNGETYELQQSSGGLFYKDGQSNPNATGQEHIVWDYETADGAHYLSIEQWGERDFAAHEGWPVQEYQFTNILPAA